MKLDIFIIIWGLSKVFRKIGKILIVREERGETCITIVQHSHRYQTTISTNKSKMPEILNGKSRLTGAQFNKCLQAYLTWMDLCVTN